MKYDCKICGKRHDVYFGISAGVSQRLDSIIKQEPQRVTETEYNLFLLDGSTAIIPGVITIPTSCESDFFYETWVECRILDFIDMTERMGITGTTSLRGKLYDDLYPCFPNSKGMNCNVEFNLDGSVDQKAKITITDDGTLKEYQCNGINESQLEVLMNRLYHTES